MRVKAENTAENCCLVPGAKRPWPSQSRLRTVLAPRIYEGGGPRSGRGSPPPQRGKPPQSRLRRASSPKGRAKGASHRSCPRIYEGGGPRSGGGSPPPQRGRPSQSRCARQLSQRESQGSCAPFLPPRIYEGGGPRSGRGSLPAAAGITSSVTASPCQLSQRGSRGRFAPFLPPAFMRGEGHTVAGGVPRRSGGESLLSHGFAVPAPPEGKPRVLRTVPAPRIYEGGGPRSGRGSSPQRRGLPPQSRLRRASSPRGEAEGASHRSCPPHL